MRRWASDPLRAPPLHERLQLRPTALCGRRAPADTAGGLGRRRLLVTTESAAACGAAVMPQRAGCGCPDWRRRQPRSQCPQPMAMWTVQALAPGVLALRPGLLQDSRLLGLVYWARACNRRACACTRACAARAPTPPLAAQVTQQTARHRSATAAGRLSMRWAGPPPATASCSPGGHSISSKAGGPGRAFGGRSPLRARVLPRRQLVASPLVSPVLLGRSSSAGSPARQLRDWRRRVHGRRRRPG